jgi:hypothetical protein
MSAPDISREAVERLARVHEGFGWPSDVPTPEGTVTAVTVATLRALRAALDAAQEEATRRTREVELTCRVQMRLTAERDAADATGYARGVQDAAALFPDSPRWQSPADTRAAILAMLAKETPDAE